MADSDAGGYDFALYRYTPSLPTAITAATVFGILTGGHFWRMFRNQTWFCLPFAVGGVCEFSPFLLYRQPSTTISQPLICITSLARV